MKIFLQLASVGLSIVAIGVSVVTYQQVQGLKTGDHSSAEAVEKLRQDIATYVAQKRVATGEQAKALQQGLTEDLKKFQEASKDYLKPPPSGQLEKIFSSPSPLPTEKK
jgi:hypothetical protein